MFQPPLSMMSLSVIRTLNEKRTPGNWHVNDSTHPGSWPIIRDASEYPIAVIHVDVDRANMDFIAAAPEMVTYLLVMLDNLVADRSDDQWLSYGNLSEFELSFNDCLRVWQNMDEYYWKALNRHNEVLHISHPFGYPTRRQAQQAAEGWYRINRVKSVLTDRELDIGTGGSF